MIVNIFFAIENKLNCFISAKEMLSVIFALCYCVVVLSVFVDFYILINHLLKKDIGIMFCMGHSVIVDLTLHMELVPQKY